MCIYFLNWVLVRYIASALAALKRWKRQERGKSRHASYRTESKVSGICNYYRTVKELLFLTIIFVIIHCNCVIIQSKNYNQEDQIFQRVLVQCQLYTEKIVTFKEYFFGTITVNYYYFR